MSEVGPKPDEQPMAEEPRPTAEAAPAPEPAAKPTETVVKTIVPSKEPRKYNKPGPDRGLVGDLGLKSEYEAKPDYGLNNRFAAIRSYLFAGAAALAGLFAAIWLTGRFMALASLPAILILAALLGAAILRFSKPAWLRALALTPLAFAIGLAPHALFLIVFNLATPDGGDPSYPPVVGGLADAYEFTVTKLHFKSEFLFQGATLFLTGAACVAAIAAAGWWSIRTGKLSARARLAVGAAQIVALGAIATTVFSQIPTGRWAPDRYSAQLQADLNHLDQTRTRMQLVQTMAEAIRQDAPAIRQALAPALRSTALAVAQRQPANPAAAARQAGKDYASAVAKANLVGSGLAVIDPGPPGALPKASADRRSVAKVEKELAVEQQGLEAARRALDAEMVNTVGGVSTGSPAADALVGPVLNGYFEEMYERVIYRFDLVWGPQLASRLRQIDAASDHPLTTGIGRLLAATPAKDTSTP
jgi:hypothetical protein